MRHWWLTGMTAALIGGACSKGADGAECGEGTVLQGEECVALLRECGEGTVAVEGTCAPILPTQAPPLDRDFQGFAFSFVQPAYYIDLISNGTDIAVNVTWAIEEMPLWAMVGRVEGPTEFTVTQVGIDGNFDGEFADAEIFESAGDGKLEPVVRFGALASQVLTIDNLVIDGEEMPGFQGYLDGFLDLSQPAAP